ncbi:hypothetical protein [Bacillus bingmayongensis]|uniref:hypothetical protein n=1 Tax=Bacillus bingmayongensis TaxID=1150157 RepID=UPI0002D610E9|nr:hypothetical protein [Bacillus bingmayongensis]MBY0598597.1 hypothetical protein [Bacillus bingmayongensis]
MIIYTKLDYWREYGDMIVLGCKSGKETFEISTDKNRIYNAHRLKDEVYIRLDSDKNIIGIDVY